MQYLIAQINNGILCSYDEKLLCVSGCKLQVHWENFVHSVIFFTENAENIKKSYFTFLVSKWNIFYSLLKRFQLYLCDII